MYAIVYSAPDPVRSRHVGRPHRRDLVPAGLAKAFMTAELLGKPWRESTVRGDNDTGRFQTIRET